MSESRTPVIESSGNIFTDLGFGELEASTLKNAADRIVALESDLAAAQARIAELEIEVEILAGKAARIAELEAERARLAKDAGRLAVLESIPTECAFGHNPSGTWSIFGAGIPSGAADTLAEAVDCYAAIAKEKPDE